MEEIAGAKAIQAEILDDARKKAARLLEEAEAEAERSMAATVARADAVVADIVRTSESRAARFRLETMARFPLEATRMRTEFVERKLREALGDFMSGLGEESVASLAEALVARSAAFFAGRDVELSRRGLSEAAARGAAARSLGAAAQVSMREDPSLPAPGYVAASGDGGLVLRATMDIVEERLLDESRGELVAALCAAALELDAGAPPVAAVAVKGGGS